MNISAGDVSLISIPLYAREALARSLGTCCTLLLLNLTRNRRQIDSGTHHGPSEFNNENRKGVADMDGSGAPTVDDGARRPEIPSR